MVVNTLDQSLLQAYGVDLTEPEFLAEYQETRDVVSRVFPGRMELSLLQSLVINQERRGNTAAAKARELAASEKKAADAAAKAKAAAEKKAADEAAKTKAA